MKLIAFLARKQAASNAFDLFGAQMHRVAVKERVESVAYAKKYPSKIKVRDRSNFI